MPERAQSFLSGYLARGIFGIEMPASDEQLALDFRNLISAAFMDYDQYRFDVQVAACTRLLQTFDVEKVSDRLKVGTCDATRQNKFLCKGLLRTIMDRANSAPDCVVYDEVAGRTIVTYEFLDEFPHCGHEKCGVNKFRAKAQMAMAAIQYTLAAILANESDLSESHAENELCWAFQLDRLEDEATERRKRHEWAVQNSLLVTKLNPVQMEALDQPENAELFQRLTQQFLHETQARAAQLSS